MYSQGKDSTDDTCSQEGNSADRRRAAGALRSGALPLAARQWKFLEGWKEDAACSTNKLLEVWLLN